MSSTDTASQGAPCTHRHEFHSGNDAAERSTRIVLWVTLVAMVGEISAGWWFNSMAVLADGWHMSSHALAIGLSVVAYATARRYATDDRFAFGTWKIEVLSAFTSAILLVVVAAWMLFSSVERLLQPESIHYQEALVVAVIGLLVNLACAVILGRTHHGHDHGHGHGHGHEDHDHDHRAHGHGEDLNLRSAYVHVAADAATSVLAIGALLGGWLWGWSWLDPMMGVVGAGLVAWWARGLVAETGKVLLDREMDHAIVDEIRQAVETPQDRVTDLHVWRVGRNVYACAMTVVTSGPALLEAAEGRSRLGEHPEVVHSTIEIHRAA